MKNVKMKILDDYNFPSEEERKRAEKLVKSVLPKTKRKVPNQKIILVSTEWVKEKNE